jgi:SynChlorMet cassette protein ScmD
MEPPGTRIAANSGAPSIRQCSVWGDTERNGDGTAMKNDEKPIANPVVVLREEFDDWAILFDPDSGNAFGLSPTGVYMWKHLDGEHTIDEMLTTLRGDAADVPEEAGGHV